MARHFVVKCILESSADGPDVLQPQYCEIAYFTA